MGYETTTIQRVLDSINRSHYLPAIQRPFVWEPTQIIALFDSVIKGYQSIGIVLSPHVHGDGHFVVSLTRFENDYIRVKYESDLLEWVAKGHSVRMSNRDVKSTASPSLITPGSIESYEV